MDLPHNQKLLLMAAAKVAEEDTDRRLQARAITDRYDFSQQPSGWIFDATRNLGSLGLIVPYNQDGTEDDQFVQLTAAGLRKAGTFEQAELEMLSRNQLSAGTTPHSDGTRFSDGSGYADAGYLEADQDPPVFPLISGKAIYDLPAPPSISSSGWTGIASKRERLVAVRALVPSALAAVEAMLSEGGFGHNNGPPLDADEGTLDALRSLHTALGEILSLADAGALDAERAPGLINDLAVYSRRAMEGLKADPLKYAVISGLTAMGTLIWGAQFLAGAALTGAFEAKREGKKR